MSTGINKVSLSAAAFMSLCLLYLTGCSIDGHGIGKSISVFENDDAWVVNIRAGGIVVSTQRIDRSIHFGVVDRTYVVGKPTTRAAEKVSVDNSNVRGSQNRPKEAFALGNVFSVTSLETGVSISASEQRVGLSAGVRGAHFIAFSRSFNGLIYLRGSNDNPAGYQVIYKELP